MARRRSRSGRTSKTEQEFVSEAEEIIERMRGGLADLEDQRAANDEVDPEVVNRLFRSAHSLKALAGLFGLDPIRHLAHQLEEILDALRLGRVSLESPAISLIAEAVRVFATLLEAVGDAEAIEVAAAPVAGLSEQIEAAVRAARSGPEVVEALDVDPEVLRTLTEYEEHRLQESLRHGRHIVLVDATFEIDSFEAGLTALSAAVRSQGELISTLPAPDDGSDSRIRFSLLSASSLAADALAGRIDVPGASVRSAMRRAAPRAPAAATPVEGADGLPSLQSISETVRVDIRKLDELMNLVGELVIQRGALGDLITTLQSHHATAWIANDFTRVHKELNRKLKDLQTAVIDVRMVPLHQIFEKVSRVVRGLRRELGKDVRLEVRGADTELDKLLVEELVDPLMHVVRNALDHAIEAPAERVARGKPPQGRIGIDAFQRGNHVVIAVSDDGTGIDTQGLRARAEARGLVAADETLSERDVLELIFAPGISTRLGVTDTSGRGVGMDVVRTNLTALGGVVDVKSTPGSGTTISMTLPITLAIVQSLIVCVDEQRFAIPLGSVLETLLVEPREIQRSRDRELLDLRGEALPLRRLSAEFGLGTPPPEAKLFAVVVGIGDLHMGLLVDRLEGQQDTVIKPIQGPIAAIRGIAGATEIGDREPVLVLDVAALVEDPQRRREAPCP
ncbi:MAG: chemotaxis protein CheA [Myxococcales bacterium]|nr:chemotaxis protein CheA [Myxococcales bacterium]